MSDHALRPLRDASHLKSSGDSSTSLHRSAGSSSNRKRGSGAAEGYTRSISAMSHSGLRQGYVNKWSQDSWAVVVWSELAVDFPSSTIRTTRAVTRDATRHLSLTLKLPILNWLSPCTAISLSHLHSRALFAYSSGISVPQSTGCHQQIV